MKPADIVPEETLTRRQTLSALGVGVIGGLLGTVFLPGATESPPTEVPEVGETDRDVAALDESETPYAVWQYRVDSSDEFSRTLPINVVFPLENATFEDVVDVFGSARWVSFPAEYTRYAWDREREQYVPSQWSGAETYYGAAGRLHVRCWELAGTASIQAHTDTPATPSHSIRSHAEARTAVENLFTAAGWTVDEYVDLQNDSGDHDGRASKIYREES